MARQLIPRFFWYLLDVAAFIVCCFGVAHIAAKPGLPISFESRQDSLWCIQVDDQILGRTVQAGNALLKIDGQDVSYPEDVEFIFDSHSIRDRVSLLVAGPEGERVVEATLGHYYGTPYLVTVVFVVLLFFGVGLIVFWRKRDDPAARVYHLGSLLTAVMLSTTWGSYVTTPSALGVALRVTFSAAYAFVPLLFFHFVRLFPHPHPMRRKATLPVLYSVATVLAVGNGVSFADAWQEHSVPLFHTHLAWFTTTRWFMIALVFSGLWTIRQSYRSAQHESERRKLRWVVWGLFIGFFPFVVLWVIPQMLLSHSLIPEGVMLLASGFIPLAFGVSIVKYQIMDIDRLFTRSVVYGTATALVIIIYVTIVGGMAGLVSSITNEFPIGVSTAAAVIVALLFEPVRRATQGLVDRRFFRVKYDFRLAERQIQEDLKKCSSAEEMGQLLTRRIDGLLVPERITVILFAGDQPSSMPDAQGFEFLNDSLLLHLRGEVAVAAGAPLAVQEFVEPGVRFTFGYAPPFLDGSLALVYALPSSSGQTLGLVLLGRKRSGARYSREDCDLMESLATFSGMEIERVRLQRQIIEKADEADRLQRLNALKSDFVSYVSHELRTPLTSIKMFAELLLRRLPRKEQNAREYAGIIEGESERLQRMVDTILDSAKIDNGEQHYSPREVDFERVIRDVLKTLRYQLAKEKFKVRVKIQKSPSAGFVIQADPDAAREAVLNLLSNAMKYSWENKEILISLVREEGRLRCSITDHGRGISPEGLGRLFEKFYRDPSLPRRIQGVGLGLSIVKHIMDAHGGTVEVNSSLGAGSTFTLVFPSSSTVGNQTPAEKGRRAH